jgi:formylglycine-generating enzyme required for sulfatase activity
MEVCLMKPTTKGITPFAIGLLLMVLFQSCGDDSTGPEDDGSGQITMKLIPGGSFFMGSVGRWARDDEQPVHYVTLSSFHISKYEITQAQYASFDPDHVSGFAGENHPVEEVTWIDAAWFCNWLSEQEGYEKFYIDSTLENDTLAVIMNWEADGYRLPTEAEWEYACRSNSVLDFYSDSLHEAYCDPVDPNLDEIAWYCGNAGDQTHEVGGKNPIGFGLYDMNGNVWEWCNDWYWDYPEDPQVDPVGPPSGNGRAKRGGGWSSYGSQCRSSTRSTFGPGGKSNDIGFRVARPAG